MLIKSYTKVTVLTWIDKGQKEQSVGLAYVALSLTEPMS